MNKALLYFLVQKSNNIISLLYLIDSDLCSPKDNNACLQESVGWDPSYTCSSSTQYCSSFGKDMRRCCPDSCGTGVFSPEDCISFDGKGTCAYPNGAQCYESGNIYEYNLLLCCSYINTNLLLYC